jgi:hypothetical protein
MALKVSKSIARFPAFITGYRICRLIVISNLLFMTFIEWC